MIYIGIILILLALVGGIIGSIYIIYDGRKLEDETMYIGILGLILTVCLFLASLNGALIFFKGL